MTKYYFVVLFLLGLLSNNQAQRIIKGNVTDASSGEPLIGANVVCKEKPEVGTITDLDGNFELTIEKNITTLVISYAGYQSAEKTLDNLNTLSIALTPGEILEDVVIIGYGTVKREDATGSVQTVTSDKFNRGAITSPQDLISGKIAGVNISSGGGPGDGAAIRIRGESSLAASNDPLIVIDGIPISEGNVSGSRNALNLINPNDIETFTVLKDASAAAIYGNRASAGVILITTKKGAKNGQLKVGYSANFSVGKIAKTVDVLTSNEFRDLLNSQYPERDPNPDKLFPPDLLGTESTNWQDLIYQDAFGHDHNLTFSGGVSNVPVRVSLGYTNKNGLLKTDNFNRLSSNLNLSPSFLDNRLQVNAGIKYSLSNNHFADRGAIGSALSFDPTQNPYDEGNPYGGYFAWQRDSTLLSLAPANPLALLNLKNDESKVNQYIANGSIDYRFKAIPALRANLNLGHEYNFGSGTVSVSEMASFAQNPNGNGSKNTYDQTKKNSLLEFYLNYKKTFGIHGIDLMGGYSWQHLFETRNSRNATANDTYVFDEFKNIAQELYLLSLFSRLNYTLQDRYLLTLSLRRDGTSRFGPDARWGLFPAAALAVKLIDDNKKTYLNNVKLRLGYGVTGQERGGGYYEWQGLYSQSLPNAQYQLGNEFYNTQRPNAYNERIVWEENTTYNAAVDVSIIKDVLSGTFELYKRSAKNAIANVPVPALQNLSNFGNINIGTMEGNGFETSILYSPFHKSKDFSWDIAANFSTNINKVTKLNVQEDSTSTGIDVGGIAGGVGSNIQKLRTGYQTYSFYVYKQLYDESGHILENQFEDLNGDGKIDGSDRYMYKNRAPKYTFGLTNNLRYKKLDLAFAARAYIGNYVYNNVQTDMGYINRIVHPTAYLVNVNQSAVDLNVYDQSSLTFSDYFVKDASFLKIDHITLGYNFDNVIGKFLRLYATIQNPIVLTKYDGIDPEQFSGIDNNTYPRPRTYVLGLSVDF